jgi:hypothetical protein
MPMRGGAIQLAYRPGSVQGFILGAQAAGAITIRPEAVFEMGMW